MRALAILMLMPLLLAAVDLKIDHVSVAGRDLQALRAALEAVGVASQYGGPHGNHATEMALTSFPDGSYLELIAIQPHADAAAVARDQWAKWLEGDGGPCAWALRVPDVTAEVARLRAAGVEVSPPVRGGRTRPDGVPLDWENASVGTGPSGTFFPFIIHDLTPRPLRAWPSRKPTTRDFAGVAHVVIAVHNLKDAAARYHQAFGIPAPLQQVDSEFGAHLAALGGTPVILAAPLNADSWLAGRLAKLGEGPCAFVLAGRKTGRYRAAAHSRWFGSDISWFDSHKLGWRLGWQ